MKHTQSPNELIKDAAFFGGTIRSSRYKECREYFDKTEVDALLQSYNNYLSVQYHGCSPDKEDIKEFKQWLGLVD